MSENFEGLTDAELEVFGQLTVNADQGHPPTILAALLAKGLIVHPEGKHGPLDVVRIDQHVVPLDVHERWCEWCHEHYDESGRRRRKPKERAARAIDPTAVIGALPGLGGDGE